MHAIISKRMASIHSFAAVAISTIALLCIPSLARAQGENMMPRYKAISLAGGISQFDLSGTGTSALLGARADIELNRWLVTEGSLTGMRPDEQFTQKVTYIIPELQLQLQAPLRVVRPYIGLGGGFARRTAEGLSDNIKTVSGAGGVRFLVPNSKLVAQGELRLRGLGSSFTGSSAEWTAGLGWRF